MESALTAPKLRWVLVYIIIVNSRGLVVSSLVTKYDYKKRVAV
jgi:hypothetical protein